jgi:hypothetical protein
MRGDAVADRTRGHPVKRQWPPVLSRGKDCPIGLVYAMEGAYRIDVTLRNLTYGAVGV